MRLLFGLCCLGVLVGAAQIGYWALLAPDLFDNPRIQAVYWGIGLLLGVTTVAAGLLNWRRLFTVACLVACLLHITVTSVFNLSLLGTRSGDLMSRQVSMWDTRDQNTRFYLWNLAVIGVNAAVCYYLLRYEIPRWRRNSPS